MKITVVGWDGPKTEQMLLNAQAALDEIEPNSNVEWTRDIQEMRKMGIIRTPALIINSSLKVAGRVPSINEITKWMKSEMAVDITTYQEEITV